MYQLSYANMRLESYPSMLCTDLCQFKGVDDGRDSLLECHRLIYTADEQTQGLYLISMCRS